RSGKGSVPEVQPGNPAATPALIASWEVNEAVKILLGGKGVLCDELLYLDLLNNEVDRIPLK
ncbi:MAG: HesA/MoeB/ThiF family protein, partial [Firmicutes bacterium]|nr:HesA/MoeB/ThiF family protein [Bacillota bacterium]